MNLVCFAVGFVCPFICLKFSLNIHKIFNWRLNCFFKGEVIILAEGLDRAKTDRGNYLVGGKVIDCYDNVQKGICKASRENSPFMCRNKKGKSALANAKLISGRKRDGTSQARLIA